MRGKADFPFQNLIENNPQNIAFCRAIRLQTSLTTLSVTVGLLLLYLLQTAGMSILLYLDQTFPGKFSLQMLAEFFTTLLYPIAFFLPFLWLAKQSKVSSHQLSFARPYLPITFAAMGICVGCSAVLSMLLSPILPTQWGGLLLRPPIDPIARVFYLINILLLPAFIEELVYRGILLELFRPFGDRLAIFFCAILFALMHRNWVQLPNALLMGLLLGYFVVQTRTLWTGILIHLCNNLLVIFWELILVAQPPSRMVVLQLLRFGSLIAAGLLGGFYLWKRGVPLKIPKKDLPITERRGLSIILFHPSMLVLFALFGWIFYLNAG